MRGETLAAGESKTVHGSEGMMLIYCGAGEVHVIVGDEASSSRLTRPRASTATRARSSSAPKRAQS